MFLLGSALLVVVGEKAGVEHGDVDLLRPGSYDLLQSVFPADVRRRVGVDVKSPSLADVDGRVANHLAERPTAHDCVIGKRLSIYGTDLYILSSPFPPYLSLLYQFFAPLCHSITLPLTYPSMSSPFPSPTPSSLSPSLTYLIQTHRLLFPSST